MLMKTSNLSSLLPITLILCVVAVSGLKIHTRSQGPLLFHALSKNLRHNYYHEPKSQNHDAEIPESVFNNLKEFVADDELIMNRIHAEKPLTKASAQKIKNYFLQNQQFRQFTLKNLVSYAKNPNCLDGIVDQSRDRLFKIIMDQLDFRTIFLTQKPQEEFTEDEINAIVLQLKTDKQLRPYLEICFGRNAS